MNSLYTLQFAPINSTILTNTYKHHNNNISSNNSRIICRASSKYSSITEFNLYDLLGVDRSCDNAQIKSAYRTLQKRCHPDIAGEAGHEMAIILNEAYALLSDPISRLAYDKEHAKFSDLEGYTGQPIYSAWFGNEAEERAVFVDESKCVGCLKCALLAKKTFAIESVYGRARVIGQWADPEHKIQEAIDACPVDCISITKKSDLAALEFLMSKQPREKVRIGTGNTVGARSSDVFQELKKFQAKYDASKKKVAEDDDPILDAQRGARMAAIQAIRKVTDWLYWRTPMSGNASPSRRNLKLIPQNSSEPDIQKLRDVAEAKKRASQHKRPTSKINGEYWVPLSLELPETANDDTDDLKPRSGKTNIANEVFYEKFPRRQRNVERNPFFWVLPFSSATVAAITARMLVQGESSGDIKEHIGGSLALQVVNSSWLQVILAGVTWFLIGMAVMELLESIQSKVRKDEQ
ncbi:hypothetical protein Leryth_000437 [Lithospermum erythrorhizon]|nr:hypothetical protein Leryth_000437 [Lithospermum erythrorhizon]